jgi:hypothetical protein
MMLVSLVTALRKLKEIAKALHGHDESEIDTMLPLVKANSEVDISAMISGDQGPAFTFTSPYLDAAHAQIPENQQEDKYLKSVAEWSVPDALDETLESKERRKAKEKKKKKQGHQVGNCFDTCDDDLCEIDMNQDEPTTGWKIWMPKSKQSKSRGSATATTFCQECERLHPN